MTTNLDVYFVAWYKHDRPQHLIAGPFVYKQEALAWAAKTPAGVVVRTTLPFEEEDVE